MKFISIAALLSSTSLITGCTTLRQAAAHRDPLTPEEYVALGSTYETQGDREPAKQKYEAALRVDKKYHPALIHLGNLAFDDKDYEQARDYFKRAAKIKPGDPAAINNLAMVDLAEGKSLDESLLALENALPNAGGMRPYLLDTLANIAIRQNRFDDAKRLIAQAKKEAPVQDPSFNKTIAATEEKLAKLIK